MPDTDDGRRDAPVSSTPVPAWLDAATLRWAADMLHGDAEKYTGSPDPELCKVGAERYAAAARLSEWADSIGQPAIGHQ